MNTHHINFYLRKSRINNKGEAPITVSIVLPTEKAVISTGLSINPGYWDVKKQKAVRCSNSNSINELLQDTQGKILKAISQLSVINEDISIENIKKLLSGETIKETCLLIKVTKEHNAQFEQLIGIRYSAGSYKNYKTSLLFLTEFISTTYKKNDIAVKQLDHKFCEQFFVWLTTVKTCKQNGAYKHMQRLKKIVNYSHKMGYIESNPILSYSVKLKPVNRLPLTWEEVVRIQQLQLQTEKLREIKDVFMFQIFTGLPYSDVKAFSKKHLLKSIDNKIWIKMERTKTKNQFSLPLLPTAIEILHRYVKPDADLDTPIFPVLSNQKYNQNLKVIQELASISKNLHTHLPRHTFATTITLLNGVPLETVSKMLGHSRINITQSYAKVGELKIAAEMTLLEKKLSEEGK